MPKYTRNSGKRWTGGQVKQLRKLAKQNTPTRVIGLKMGRPVGGVYAKSEQEGDFAEADEPAAVHAAEGEVIRQIRRCAICGTLLTPLLAHQIRLPTDCRCMVRHSVEVQAPSPPEQPEVGPRCSRYSRSS